PRAVLLFGFADEKTIKLAADYRGSHDDGVRAHSQTAYGLGSPATLSNLFEEDLAGEPCSAGIQGCGPAIDVIVAGPARGELELAKPKRLLREQTHQLITSGGHEFLR